MVGVLQGALLVGGRDKPLDGLELGAIGVANLDVVEVCLEVAGARKDRGGEQGLVVVAEIDDERGVEATVALGEAEEVLVVLKRELDEGREKVAREGGVRRRGNKGVAVREDAGAPVVAAELVEEGSDLFDVVCGAFGGTHLGEHVHAELEVGRGGGGLLHVADEMAGIAAVAADEGQGGLDVVVPALIIVEEVDETVATDRGLANLACNHRGVVEHVGGELLALLEHGVVAALGRIGAARLDGGVEGEAQGLHRHRTLLQHGAELGIHFAVLAGVVEGASLLHRARKRRRRQKDGRHGPKGSTRKIDNLSAHHSYLKLSRAKLILSKKHAIIPPGRG